MTSDQYKIKLLTEALKKFTVPTLKTSGIPPEVIAKRILEIIEQEPPNQETRLVCKECYCVCDLSISHDNASSCCEADTFEAVDFRIDDKGRYYGNGVVFPRLHDDNPDKPDFAVDKLLD